MEKRSVINPRAFAVIRKRRGLTAATIAEEVGVAPSTYSEFENGKRTFETAKMLKIHEILDIAEGELREASEEIGSQELNEGEVVYNAGRKTSSRERDLLEWLVKEILGTARGHDIAVQLINEAKKGDAEASARARLILEILEK